MGAAEAPAVDGESVEGSVINEATDAANSESGVSESDADTNEGVNDTIEY